MATTTVQFDGDDNKSYLAEVFADGGDVILASGIPVEKTNNLGTYDFTVTPSLSGEHQVRVSEGGVSRLKYWVDLQDDTSTYVCYDRTNIPVKTSLDSLTVLLTSLSASSTTNVIRGIDDETPISFVWPTISGASNLSANSTVSVDNLQTFVPVSGAITYVNQINNRYWYQIAYDASDRPVEEGVSRFILADGTYTKEFSLTIPSNSGSGGSGGSIYAYDGV